MKNISTKLKCKRSEKIFDVVEYLPKTKEVCVLYEVEYAESPYKRTLKLWWTLNDDCEIIK